MDFDAIVIGTGRGAPLAARLARDGRSVLLAERRDLGGTCVNTGGTPTKTLVANARAAHVTRTGFRLGVHAEAVRVDFPTVIARKDAIVRAWQEGVARRVEAAGPSLHLMRGRDRYGRSRRSERRDAAELR